MTEQIKDARGNKLGEIRDCGSRRAAYDSRSNKLGEFDGRCTYDNRGCKIGEGNLLAGFIMAAKR